MTRDDVFFQDILARPDDDTPRLIYADWLEERGDPEGALRAEFIRVQCAVAKLTEDDPRYPKLERRERAFLERYRAELIAPLPPAPQFGFQPPLTYSGFRRGFLQVDFAERGVSRVWMTVGQFQELAGGWFERRLIVPVGVFNEPVGDRAVPIFGDGGLRRLAACHYLGLASALRLQRADVGDEGVRALAASPHVTPLVSLNLFNNHVGAAGLASLAASPHFLSLTALDLGGNEVGNAGAQSLAGAAGLSRLEALNLSRNRIGDAGVVALAASPHLAHLTTLNLRYNPLGKASALALADPGHLPRLVTLHLRGTGLGKKGRQTLEAHFGAGVTF